MISADLLGSRGADISPCGLYRYSLWREWDDRLLRCVFVGLNPSTADGERDDPTIRRCIRFARDWGFGGLWMANLYAYRATDPRVLTEAVGAGIDPVGPTNDQTLLTLAQNAGCTVAAWGAWHGPDPHRPAAVMDLIGGLHILGLTKKGEPRHPLYMAAATRPTRWTHA